MRFAVFNDSAWPEVELAAYPAARGALPPVAAAVEAAGHQKVGVYKVGGAADVLPHALQLETLQPLPPPHEHGEQVLGEVVERVLRDEGEHPPVHHVYPRVDEVGEDLLRVRLLAELLDPAVRADAYDAVLAGAVDMGEGDGDGGAGAEVLGDLRADLEVGEGVAVGGDENGVEAALESLHGAARA
ncbi:hypothetical protein PAA26_04920 [Methanomassiliicoccaceae archaeon COG_1]|nr:hypothetical protein [Methanomassiliicoccaceae archaeon COG_1]